MIPTHLDRGVTDQQPYICQRVFTRTAISQPTSKHRCTSICMQASSIELGLVLQGRFQLNLDSRLENAARRLLVDPRATIVQDHLPSSGYSTHTYMCGSVAMPGVTQDRMQRSQSRQEQQPIISPVQDPNYWHPIGEDATQPFVNRQSHSVPPSPFQMIRHIE